MSGFKHTDDVEMAKGRKHRPGGEERGLAVHELRSSVWEPGGPASHMIKFWAYIVAPTNRSRFSDWSVWEIVEFWL